MSFLSRMAIPSWRTYARVILALSLAAHMAAAWLGSGFHMCDEHFQILELAWHKLGRTADLPWEFDARLRSWTQPAAYYGLLSLLGACGVDGPFVLARILRLGSAVFAWSSLFAWSFCLRAWFPTDGWPRRLTIALVGLFYLVPYIGARTSGESFSQAALAWSFAALVATLDSHGSRRRLFALSFGAAAGLAFLARYQTVLVPLGVLAWAVTLGRRRCTWSDLGWALTGGGFALLVGALLDRWGYGRWEFPAWQYLVVNLLEGRAASFGVSPWWGFVPQVARGLVSPFGHLLLAGTLAAVVAQRRHVLSWAVALFVVAHAAVGHKELRFLFPVLQSSLVLVGLMFPQLATFASTCAERFSVARRGALRTLGLLRTLGIAVVVALAGVNTVALLGVSPKPDVWFPVAVIEYLTARAPAGWMVYWPEGKPSLFRRCGYRLGFYARSEFDGAPFLTSQRRDVEVRDRPTFFVAHGTPAELDAVRAPGNCIFEERRAPRTLLPVVIREAKRFDVYRCHAAAGP